jgi:hypothetical protein
MSGFLDVKVTTKKNGQQAAWFRDTLGRRVGTRIGLVYQKDITNAEQMAWLANYWIELQNEQLDAGLGSDGAPMPKLSGGSFAKFGASGDKRVFAMRKYFGYTGQKLAFGGRPIRNLLGPGIGGHMRDDIRISYVDDRTAKVSITTAKSRQKALANERRAAWWGLSPVNRRNFAQAQATVFGGAMEEYLARLELIDTGNHMVQLAKMLNQRKWKTMLRKAAA